MLFIIDLSKGIAPSDIGACKVECGYSDLDTGEYTIKDIILESRTISVIGRGSSTTKQDITTVISTLSSLDVQGTVTGEFKGSIIVSDIKVMDMRN